MSQGAVPMQFSPTLPPEEVARANFYALLASLFYAAPDAALLAALAGAEEIVSEGAGDADSAGRRLPVILERTAYGKGARSRSEIEVGMTQPMTRAEGLADR